MKRFLFVFSIVPLLSLTIHKSLSELGKWRKYHNIFNLKFEKVDKAKALDIVIQDFDLGQAEFRLFQDLFIYSKDSTRFIDLDSYSLLLEVDENQNLTSSGSGVDMKVQLVNAAERKAITILFCGTNCYPETAMWKGPNSVDIYGFELNLKGFFIPTMWQYNLETTLISKYQVNKQFRKKPASYVENIRLSNVEFIH